MPRIIDEPIGVTVLSGRPVAFIFRGNHRIKEILDRWVEIGEWWNQESEKVSYRVATDRGGVFEIYYVIVQRQWMLYKVYD